MKSPWELIGRGHDDMEALQTDVMRFMAILGLCLAAIFSLVQSPDFQSTAAPPATISVTSAEAVPKPSPEIEPPPSLESPPDKPPQSEAVVKQASTPPPVTSSSPRTQEAGFSLEFDSAESLAALVERGRVTLVVNADEVYWRWSDEGHLVKATALSGFYAMERDTVPTPYRRAAAAQLGALSKTWGVVLPSSITAQIDALVAQHQGGVLAISATGTVNREPAP